MNTIAGVALGAGAAAAVLAPLAWWLNGRRRALEARLDARETQARQGERDFGRLAAVMEGAGGFYLTFAGKDAGDAGAVASLGLAAALGLPPDPDLQRITGALIETDRPGFTAAVERLRRDGAGFALSLRAANGRTLRAAGRRLGEPGDKNDIVSLIDCSAEGALAAQLRETAAGAATEREHLQQALDALPIPVWRRDADLALAWCNAAYARAADVSAEEAVAKQRELLGVTGAQGSPGPGRALARLALDAKRPITERHHGVIGGQRRLMEVTECPTPASDEVIGFARDLTEIEEARANLERHQAAHGEVLESLASAIAIYDAGTRLIFFNSSFARLWRMDAAWLSTKPTIGEVLEAMRERRRLPEYVDFRAFKAESVRLFTSLIEQRDEMMHLPDDTTLRTLVAPHPLGGLMFLYEDVTDRLVLERSFNTLTEVQRETLNNMHEGVAVFGGDGRLRLSNPEFARLWNLSPEDLDDEPHVADLIEKTRPMFAGNGNWTERKAQIVSRITEPEVRTGRLERRDGKVVEFALTPLPDGAALLSYLDVTDRYRVERALRDRNLALEAADKLKTEFIANVSYELRTPLNAIIGFTEILANQFFGKLNARQKEYVQHILTSSAGLRNLINDILDLATIEAGYMELNRVPVDVAALLNATAQLTRERARERELTVAIDCPADIGDLPADERRLKQAMFNLVSNAVKFTPAGGTITLSARRAGGEVRLGVTDTGIGISPEDLTRVFNKFERGTGQGRQAGAGLGLALVKSLIELHGGKLSLESTRGQGTTITCALPEIAPVEEAVPLADEA